MQVYYNPSLRDSLKVQFAHVENIQQNFSNLNQDMFVLSVLNGKQNGTYLEIGGELPIRGNNTYLLESMYKWRGVSIEIDEKYQQGWSKFRKNKIYFQDALTTDYTDILTQANIGPVIDYLSCDIEPQELTLQALTTIDHAAYRFRVITFEHDHYNGGQGPRVRDDSRAFLSNLGYRLLVGDASHQGNRVEDWWVDPNLVDRDTMNLLALAETWNADEAIYTRPPSASIKPGNRTI
jgi:hypothetical protein